MASNIGRRVICQKFLNTRIIETLLLLLIGLCKLCAKTADIGGRFSQPVLNLAEVDFMATNMDDGKIMRVGCYIRVSTQEQAKEGYSIGAQTERLKSYCVARGWVASQMYTDPGFSGAKLERPALQKLISDVKSHRIDLVLVYKLDRLSRSQKDTLFLIEDVFIKNDVAFVSINENFDTSTAFGRAMIGILSVFAQLEREQIKERTQMGRAERAKIGLWHGGGFVPIGYDYNEAAGALTINEYEAMQVREVFDLYVNKHYSFNKIQQHMMQNGYRHKHGGWLHTSTIKNVLHNNIYLSTITWEGNDYEGQHEAILSSELFLSAQKRLEDTKWKKGGTPKISPFSSTQLLSGILYCGNCGGRYFGSGAYRGSHKLPNSEREYVHIYSCYSRAKTKKEMIKDPSCKNANWRVERLDKYVTDLISSLNFDDNFDQIASKPPSDTEELTVKKTIENQIAILDGQMTRILDLLQYQNLPMEKAVERLEGIAKEKSALESTLDGMNIKQAPVSHDEARETIRDAAEILANGSLETKRELIQSLIESITIYENEISIKWRFL